MIAMDAKDTGKHRLMNEAVPGPMARAQFKQWLSMGGPPLQIREKNHCAMVISLPKTERFDYLFCETDGSDACIHWDKQFSFCGLYDRHRETLHLADSRLQSAVSGLTPEERMDSAALRQRFCGQVNQRVEELVESSRKHLLVQDIYSQDPRGELSYYLRYGAEEEAERLFFDRKEPDTRFHGGYTLANWSEQDLLDYLQNPEGLIQSEAEHYIEWEEETLLSQLLKKDALQSAYTRLLKDAENPIHRMRAIAEALEASGAQTVEVTVQKGGQALTFQAEASLLKWHCSHCDTYPVTASERKAFEQMFGCRSTYTAEEIANIAYDGNIIYEAPCVQAEGQEETREPSMEMGGM